jgi:hypothetical protein
VHADGALDQLSEGLAVDVVEALQVEASLAGPVRPQPLEQLRIALPDAADEVQDET